MLVALVGLAVAGACTAKGPKYPDLNSFCNARASAECSMAVVLACAAPNPTCTNKRQALCISNAPARAYNAGAAEDCVTQVSNAYADAKVTLDESKSVDNACLPVFEGPGVTGTACQMDADCRTSTGLRCVPTAGSNQGTCQVPQMVAGGGSCAAPNQQCVPGYHCGTSAHCDIDATDGSMCSSQNPCGPGLLCSTAAGGMTCKAKKADGVACVSGDECQNGICNKATGAMTGICVTQVTLAPNEPFCMDSR